MFQQNDLKRKLEQLTSEASKTRKKFRETLKRVNKERREDDIRRSQETLNKSTKKKRAKKKKAAAKKKTAPKPIEEEDMSVSLSSGDETTQKTTSKKTASDKTKSKKATPKKKTALKPVAVIHTTSLPSEDDHDDLEGATIKKHSYDNEKELYTVWVSWKKSKKAEWQFLHDMWVDYPEEVKTYRDRHRLTASAWQVPNMEDASFVVRILTMNGPTPSSATFCILFDNGYLEKEAGYSDVKSDAPDLLRAFLYERDL
jgi:hypothetical protein